MLEYPMGDKWTKRTYTVPNFALTTNVTPKMDPYTVQFDKTAHTIITSITGADPITGGGSLGLYDLLMQKNGVSYANDFMRSSSLVGVADFPHFLPRPIYVGPGDSFQLNFINQVAGANVVNLAFNCISTTASASEVMAVLRRLSDGSMADGPMEYYAYVLRRQYAASERFTMSLQIGGDADFAALNLTGYSTGAFQYRIAQGSAAGDAWDDAFVTKAAVFGNAQHPFPLHARFVPAAGTLQSDTQDLSVANNFIEIALEGLKYRVGR